jgi:hypothetical protein
MEPTNGCSAVSAPPAGPKWQTTRYCINIEEFDKLGFALDLCGLSIPAVPLEAFSRIQFVSTFIPHHTHLLQMPHPQ